ncbi:hypothetical protein [uncultured Muribaculum sp.]|uniref:hypothetical protein n=1 Tax=uncultured Muribaculum sp. TaxID=1918613 RepID=UPI0025F4A78A|nr:hypothetical protein [uncultured Muribaculum sp.]
MNKTLEDYIAIYSQFRNGKLSKLERKKRHLMLTEWSKSIGPHNIPDVHELSAFWDSYPESCYNRIFIMYVVLPVVISDFDSGSIDGIKLLFRGFQEAYWRSVDNIDSPFYIFCDETGHNYFDIADRILEKEPGNLDVLNFKYKKLKSYLTFSLHEMPIGIHLMEWMVLIRPTYHICLIP